MRRLSVFMATNNWEVLRERLEAMIGSLIDAGLLQDMSAVRLPWSELAGENVEEMAIEAVQADVLLICFDSRFLASSILDNPFDIYGENLLPKIRPETHVITVYLGAAMDFDGWVENTFGQRVNPGNVILLPEKQGDERPNLMNLATPSEEETEQEHHEGREGEKLRENLSRLWGEHVEAVLIEVLSKPAA